jgi:hypothetical protein
VKRIWRRAIAVLALALVVLVGVFAPMVLRRMTFFRVRQLEIAGARYLDAADVLRGLALPPTASTLDRLAPIRRAAEAIPGVLGAKVERRLPGTLRITLREASPVAVTAQPDRLALIDSAGRLLPFDPARVPASLPIAARDSGVAALLWRVRHADRVLYDRIDAAELDHGDVVFALGPRRIRLRPEADVDVLRGVAGVLQYLGDSSVAWRALDARYRSRVFVQKGGA